MNDSDQESTCNTEDLMSGIYRLDDISPLQSPRAAVLSELTEHTQIYSLSKQTRPQQVMSEEVDSGKGSSTALAVTPQGAYFDQSNENTTVKKPASPRSRSLSPQTRIRVHYTDSAREALDLANKSYERLVEESEERQQLTILINQRDAERAHLLRQEQERAELDAIRTQNRKDEGDQMVQLQSPASSSEKPVEAIGVIQEHIRFAESILASPNSSNSSENKRTRSLSPLQPRANSPLLLRYHTAADNRSRSTSPLTRSPRSYGQSVTSSRKKLSFDNPAVTSGDRSRSPLLSRSGREKTVQHIKTQATNEFIEATSHGLYHPRSKIVSPDRMAAVSVRPHRSVSPDKVSQSSGPPRDMGTSELSEWYKVHDITNVYLTPDKKEQGRSRHRGPLSSTPHRKSREPVRDLSPSRLYCLDQQPADKRTTPSTPSTYIRGLESVRVGLRKLMTDEAASPAAAQAAADSVNRAENVSMRIESTINAENQLLRDQLSRERSLRKQIEADKHELQSQLLESKDRLHHLSSSLKQKDSTMKKLDQNLEDVVKGWQKHEQENKMASESLSHTIRRLERQLEEQGRHAAGLESDLANAIDDLKRERDASRDLTREASEQHSQYQEEMTELRNTIEREQEKALRLDLDRTQAMEGRLHVEKQLDNIQETLEQERENFKQREQELLEKINEITNVQIAVLEQEAARTKAQADKIEELDAKARKFEQEAESQRHLVSSKSKEVERLQSLLELTDAKHQNSVRQLESKLRIELELRVSQAKDDGLKRMADNEIGLQQAHQRQLTEVVSEQNRQLGSMRERYNNEINRIKGQLQDQLKTVGSSLDEKKRELDLVLSEKENIETQRDDLNNRLQAVLTLLGAAANGQGAAGLGSYLPAVPAHPSKSSYGSSSGHTGSIPSLHTPSYVSEARSAPPPPSHKQQNNSTPLKKRVPNDQLLMVSTTDTSGEASSPPVPNSDSNRGYTSSEAHSDSNYQQQYQQHRQQLAEEAGMSEDTQTDRGDKSQSVEAERDDEVKSTVSTDTYDLNENESMYRHKRQAELQDYIKKLLNRSVGDPLIETRIDLDESHISVISGLHDHSVILHDPDNHESPKKAFRKEIVGSSLLTGHTPPVKGSSKKVDPKEIASLITKYGGQNGNNGATPSTAEYLQYLKSVAVNNHTGFIKELDRNDRNTKRDLTESFDRSSTNRSSTSRKSSSGSSRIKPLTPEKSTLSKQAKEKDRNRVKRHSAGTKTQAIWK